MKRLIYCLLILLIIMVQVSVASTWDDAIELIKQGNFEDGVVLLDKSIDEGDFRGHYTLAKMYKQGVYYEKSIEKAVGELYKGSAKGDDWADFELGVIFTHEQYDYLDPDKGVKHFKRAIEYASNLENKSTAMYFLAKAYFNLFSPGKDKEALVLLSEAVDLGNPSAMTSLGNRYMLGKKVKHDHEKAYYLLRKASIATNGDSGQFNADQLKRHFLDDATVRRIEAKLKAEQGM